MTRANIVIIDQYGQKGKFQANSSAYPEFIGPLLLGLISNCFSVNRAFEDKPNNFGFYSPDSIELSQLISDAGLTIGHVGNFSYHYEVNFQNE